MLCNQVNEIKKCLKYFFRNIGPKFMRTTREMTLRLNFLKLVLYINSKLKSGITYEQIEGLSGY